MTTLFVSVSTIFALLALFMGLFSFLSSGRAYEDPSEVASCAKWGRNLAMVSFVFSVASLSTPIMAISAVVLGVSQYLYRTLESC